MFETILLQTIIPVVTMAVITWIGRGLKEQIDRQKDQAAKTEATKAVDKAIDETQELAVKFRVMAEDGKLTREEKGTLKELAVSKAINYATGDAGKYLLKIGLDAVGDIVEAVLGKKKTVQ